MIVHRPSDTLKTADLGWLQARFHVEIDGPAFGRIRAWNDDRFAALSGFPMHQHRDMEIITVVLSGAISHQDSLGNVSRLAAGAIQVMSAGQGVRHSEMNRETEETRLFQIWLTPDQPGGDPGWSMLTTQADPEDRFVVVASGFEADGADVPIRAQARLLTATLAAGETLHHDLAPGHVAYLVVVSGSVRIGALIVPAGDGVAVSEEAALDLISDDGARLVAVESALLAAST